MDRRNGLLSAMLTGYCGPFFSRLVKVYSIILLNKF